MTGSFFFFFLISDPISLLLEVDMSGHSSPADPPQLILNEERKQFVAAMIQPAMASLGQVTETRQVNKTFHLPLPDLQLLNQSIFSCNAITRIYFSKSVWLGMLRVLGCGQYILAKKFVIQPNVLTRMLSPVV